MTGLEQIVDYQYLIQKRRDLIDELTVESIPPDRAQRVLLEIQNITFYLEHFAELENLRPFERMRRKPQDERSEKPMPETG